MKRCKVLYREEASADILGLYRWIFDVSMDPETARRCAQRLLDACERIGDAPYCGRMRDDLYPGLRTFPFEKRAVIAYFVRNDAVEIANIFYGGRDYEALYR